MHLLVIVAWVQAVYYMVTGIWPIVHIGSFMAVTGPKRDLWLVKTVGWCIVVIGLAIAVAAGRDEIDVAITVLAVGSAAALTGVDVWYWAKGTIPRIYLLDAAGEIVLIAGWAAG